MSYLNKFEDVKFYGKTYKIKYTGKTKRIPAKNYVDINGYEIEKESEIRKQLGMYIDNDLIYTVTSIGDIISSDNKKIGKINIKPTNQ